VSKFAEPWCFPDAIREKVGPPAKRARLPYKLRCDAAAHRCRDRRFGTLENVLAAAVEAEGDGCKTLIAYVPNPGTYELIFDHSNPDAYAERREELARLDAAPSESREEGS
jgi:hypothetical protein